jgi:YrbI family 3-deoxy-D-manno-octulosonate 8-phosphate phosphatase
MQLSSQQLKSIQLLAFDFDGVFTDNTVIISENGEESVRCWRSDGLGLSLLKKLGIHLHIISSEQNLVVSKRAKKLGIECIQGIDNKAKALKKISSNLDIDMKNVMFVGNDINDIPAFKIAGFPVCVADSHQSVVEYASYKLKKDGGKGAVREVCDLIYYAHDETTAS